MEPYFEMAYPESFYRSHTPNDPFWSVAESPFFPSSPLRGKRILFLGSSVTLGLRSENEAVADYLQKQDGLIAIKEAVSGTTLRQEHWEDLSYVSRLLRYETTPEQNSLDAVIIQLSTNDAWDPKRLGIPLERASSETTFGAIEVLIQEVRRHFSCPLYFYTGAYYDLFNGGVYRQMVDGVHVIAQKYGVGVIDLYSDPDFNARGKERYAYWMSDPIHPFRSGYRAWWTPYFRAFLLQNLCKSSVFSL